MSSNLFFVIGILLNLVVQATVLVGAAALLFFFWGLATYILNAGNDEKKKEGRNIMIWGLLALFIMVSVWGIINVIRDTLELDDNSIEVPGIDINDNSGQTRG